MSGRVPDPQARLDRLLEAHALLDDVAGSLGPALPLEEVLATILRAMRKVVDFRGGTIQLVDEGSIRVAAADPPVSPEVAALRIPIGQGLSGRAVATGYPILSEDLDNDDRVDPRVRNTGSNAGMRSYLAVPLVCLRDVIGTLQVDSPEPDAFDEDDVTILRGLAAHVAAVIESARRYEMVTELERLKADFIGRVSHELRNPLTVVDGFLQMMLARVDDLDSAGRRELLERCQAATDRLSALVDEVVNVSRLTTGLWASAPERMPARELLEAVRDEASDPSLVTIDCPDDLEIEVDPLLARRALAALVDNALKFGQEASLVATAEAIDVRDNGPGIHPGVAGRAFELFTRGPGTEGLPGLGLGLPMARIVAGLIGADVEIVPADKGTTVRLHLGSR